MKFKIFYNDYDYNEYEFTRTTADENSGYYIDWLIYSEYESYYCTRWYAVPMNHYLEEGSLCRYSRKELHEDIDKTTSELFEWKESCFGEPHCEFRKLQDAYKEFKESFYKKEGEKIEKNKER
jgi:hypothetical protein